MCLVYPRPVVNTAAKAKEIPCPNRGPDTSAILHGRRLRRGFSASRDTVTTIHPQNNALATRVGVAHHAPGVLAHGVALVEEDVRVVGVVGGAEGERLVSWGREWWGAWHV